MTLQALIGLARIALAAIAFGAAPIADNSACGSEQSPASVEMVADAGQSAHQSTNQTDDGKQLPDFAHCVHGHCHSSATSNQASAEYAYYAVGEAVAPARDTSLVLPSVSNGLERPPKA